MSVKKGALGIIELFESAGYKAYEVGGCVRDSLLCRPISDIDIAVSSAPDDSAALLEKHGIKVVKTGIKHGTVTAVTEYGAYEITTFRTDGDYSDNRRPDSVSFVGDIESDLARRDFTVNAMAYNPKEGIIDLFCGRDDLEKRLIRAVGDPETRFREDALRILRALRFSSVLDFEIEQQTLAAAEKLSPLLKNISRERVTLELQKLVCGKGAARVVCFCGGILERAGLPKYDAARLSAAYAGLPPRADMRLCALCLAANDSECKSLSSLRLDSAGLDSIRAMAGVLSNAIPTSAPDARKMMSRYGAKYSADAYTLGVSLGIEKSARALELVNAARAAGDAVTVDALAVKGGELKGYFSDARQIGKAQRRVLELVMEGKLKNERGEILNYIKNSTDFD